MKRLRLRRNVAVPSTPVKPVAKASPPAPKPKATKKPPAPTSHIPSITPKQEAFVQAYLESGNALQSAKKAGYSAVSAGVLGHRLLNNVNVAAAIAKKRERLAVKFDVTRERVIGELALVAFANMGDYVRIDADGDPGWDLSAMTREQAAAVQEITIEEFKDGRSDKREVRRTKLKLSPKLGALELIGKHLGLFVEKVEHKHAHEHSVFGMLLKEIDGETRGGRVIDLTATEVFPDE